MRILELPSEGRVAFASDFHLRGERPQELEACLRVFETLADESHTVFILGDLFDLWIGPRSAKSWFARRTLECFRELKDGGTRFCFVPGNRDFLLDPGTGEEFGLEVLPEQVILEGQGRRILLLHGDQLCVRDESYRRATRILRSRPVQGLVCRLPGAISHYLAQGYRDHSRRITRVKSQRSMDLCFDVVARQFDLGIDGIVCGHVHDPRHYVGLDDGTGGAPRKDLVVLSTWEASEGGCGVAGRYGILEDGEIRLVPYPDSEENVGLESADAGGSVPEGGAPEPAREEPKMNYDRDLIVTIDGPAGVGKTTVSRAVADALGYSVLDSGSLYRAFTVAALDAGIDPSDGERLGELASAVELELRVGGRVLLDGQDVTNRLRSGEVSEAVSRVSSHPQVREALFDLQRSVGRRRRLIAEGRDMGTVIFPEAEVKFFLEASIEERARRRHRELQVTVPPPTYAYVLREVQSRDELDASRDASPLRPADDAIRVATDRLTTDEVIETLVEQIRTIGGRGA